MLIFLPKISAIGNEDSTYKIRKKITNCLLNIGLNEFIHYSLVNKKTFLNNEVELINPLLVDYSSLRRSLLPNLLKTVQENLKQKNLSIEGFKTTDTLNLETNNSFQKPTNKFLKSIFTKPELTALHKDKNILLLSDGQIKKIILFYETNNNLMLICVSDDYEYASLDDNMDIYIELFKNLDQGIYDFY